MKYIKTFKEHTEFVDSGCAYYINVAYCRKEDEVHYCMDRPEPGPEEYLTFTMLSNGIIGWEIKQGNLPVTIEYRVNGGGWTEITSSTLNPPTIQASAGDIIQFKGNNATYTYTDENFSSTGFHVKGEFDASGNIMSMLGDPEYVNSEGWFVGFFQRCPGLTSAENLLLPATTLTPGCYSGMFSGCTSLTTAPELPATTLAPSCYGYMFRGCTNLTTAPELPATTLVERCYSYMFLGCTSLNYARVLATDTSADSCVASMFSNTSSSGTLIIDGCGLAWERDYDFPSNWTVYDMNGNNINYCYPGHSEAK